MKAEDSRRYLAYLATIAAGLSTPVFVSGAAQAATDSAHTVTVSDSARTALAAQAAESDREALSADGLFSRHNQTYNEVYNEVINPPYLQRVQPYLQSITPGSPDRTSAATPLSRILDELA
ncbi:MULTISPECIES: hypothetical protein [unclassified Streptomyces]|uniref:hypothetical protein n=1 Tax=unclassified Streptomyces TaxID=2593676 RepID=UPI00093CE2CB|nr:hypothetical protein [Streptomyces sp. CB02400]OKJ88300.1 hypothetical protein AMK33_37635 [Streptomyces sp. CB02400]